MAMFTKDGSEKSEGRAEAAGEGAMSIIALGMTVTGDMDCNGVLKIEGTLVGNVKGARQLLLGRQGEVRGDVTAREVVLGGRVQGSVFAAERVEVQGTSIVVGDIHTKSIVVLEGGKINGSVRMDEAGGAAAAFSDLDARQKVAVVR